jgi:hypothetical protein
MENGTIPLLRAEGEIDQVIFAQALSLLIFAPEGGREWPDVSVGQGWAIASGEICALRQQRPAGLLGHGERFSQERKHRAVESEAGEGVAARGNPGIDGLWISPLIENMKWDVWGQK